MTNLKIFSSGIKKIPYLSSFLPEFAINKNPAEAIAGWGLRPTTQQARAYAQKQGLPFISLEDGFLRSLGLGIQGWAPLSMVVDDLGIYYDTSRPSRLEYYVLEAKHFSEETLTQAQRAIELIVQHGLSKYNHAPDLTSTLSSGREVVLLIDQTFGDMAVKSGGASEADFDQMFQTALAEHPHADIWIKIHPDVLSGKKKGYLTNITCSDRVHIFSKDVSPLSLLAQADVVYCVTSQMGFEALLLGKEVHVFGLPWYAGWGVTNDRHPRAQALAQSNRRAPRDVLQLFSAAYLRYSRYLNPNTGEAGNIFDVIAYLIQARQLNTCLQGEIYCVGISIWKRAVMKPFFNVPSCHLKFVRSIKSLPTTMPEGARLLVWGSGKEALLATAKQRHMAMLRMEDGFIRSVGLGSNLVPPLSLVVDDMGIYFDPTTPSRLEHILQNTTFSPQDQQQAEELREALLHSGVNKYNVGGAALHLPKNIGKVVLVPGQVEDDASIRRGAPEIHANLALLKAVRAACPDAYIIYKPHPDVISGNRKGEIAETEALKYANQIAKEYNINTCLDAADEVHTMTSLTGFEALLRNKHVVCYGLPFYAGWGLTEDRLTLPRRSRHLALWQLIAGTLIHYPCYIHPKRRHIINAATAVTILAQQKQSTNPANSLLKRSWIKKQAGKLKHLFLSLK